MHMKKLIALAALAVVLTSGAAAVVTTTPTKVATTLSPYDIHLNYEGMKDLPVYDSTNAI
jgi:hypothetical protein